MNYSVFTLYGKDDSRRMTVRLEEREDGCANFSVALRSTSDEFFKLRAELTMYKNKTNYAFDQHTVYRTPRALKLIHSLCEEDFFKLVTLMSVTVAPKSTFVSAGYTSAKYWDVVNLFVNVKGGR